VTDANGEASPVAPFESTRRLQSPIGGKLALSLTDAISPYRTVLTQSQSKHGRCGGAYRSYNTN